MANRENQKALNNIGLKNKPLNEESKEDFETVQQALDRLELVEKALDKACEYIANIMPFEVNEYVGVNYLYTKDKEKMKEYLLKETETKDVEMGIDKRPIREQLDEAFGNNKKEK